MERETLVRRVRHWFVGSRRPAFVGAAISGTGMVQFPRAMSSSAPRPSAEGTGSPAEKRAYLARVEEAAALVEYGRETSALVLTRETSDRRFNGAQIVIVDLEIDDQLTDGPRIIRYEHIFGPATARSWKPGHEIRIWIDPRDPMRIYAGR
jgi:hypothetical protein